MISNKDEKKLINAVLVLDIIGRPAEHLVATLQQITKDIDAEKGVSLIGSRINEPILMKDQTDFYTTFAEIEVVVEDMLYLAILMFKYMPAHIEVVSPEVLPITNTGWNDILNELTRRLHAYDEMARILGVEKDILEKKLRDVLGNSEKSKEDLKEVKESRKSKTEKAKSSKKAKKK